MSAPQFAITNDDITEREARLLEAYGPLEMARLIVELYEALAEMVRDAERNQRPGGGDVVPAKAYLALAKASDTHP